MNAWCLYLLITWVSCHMHHIEHHIDIYLENDQFLTKNQISFSIGHKKLGNSIEKGRGRIKKWKGVQKSKDSALTKRSTGSSRLRALRVSRASFSASFSLVLQGLHRFSGLRKIFVVIVADWSFFGWDFRNLEAWVLDLGRFLFFPCVITNSGADPSTFRHDQGFKCEVLPFPHLLLALASISMASGREPTTSKAQGKRPAKASKPKTRRKTCFDTALFSTVEEYQRYRQHFA